MNRNIEPSITEISRPSLWGHQQITLPNGIEIVYLHDPNQEVFKMDVVLSAGIYNQSRPVIASSMINMLNEGTRQHTSAEIAELFDYHGAYVDFNCGMHKAELSLISLNKYAPQTIRMLAEMTLESTFPQKELETKTATSGKYRKDILPCSDGIHIPYVREGTPLCKLLHTGKFRPSDSGIITRFLPGKSAGITMQNHALRECQRYGFTRSKPSLFTHEQYPPATRQDLLNTTERPR